MKWLYAWAIHWFIHQLGHGLASTTSVAMIKSQNIQDFMGWINENKNETHPSWKDCTHASIGSSIYWVMDEYQHIVLLWWSNGKHRRNSPPHEMRNEVKSYWTQFHRLFLAMVQLFDHDYGWPTSVGFIWGDWKERIKINCPRRRGGVGDWWDDKSSKEQTKENVGRQKAKWS
jgi:hypothetical protein